jgi:hypothetical protein
MRRHRYVWLLLGLVICMLLSPLTEATGVGSISLSITFSIVVVLGVNAATDSRAHLLIAITLAAIWIVSTGLFALTRAEPWITLTSVTLICLLLFAFYDIVVLLINVRASDVDALCAAFAAYLLLGLAWALSYDIIELQWPGSYSVPAATPNESRWGHFLYFSMTTLTTLGYGDTIPLRPLAGIWATLEAVVGVLYTTVLVARLVSLLRD